MTFTSALALLPGTAFSAAERKPEPYAVVAGTVFRTPGFALPGAEITVSPDPAFRPEPGSPERKGKFRKATVGGNHRGEFAVRVPPVPMRYVVRVQRKGYSPQEKTAIISGEERVELSFELEPETKP